MLATSTSRPVCVRGRLVDFVHVWVHAETTYAYQGRANVLATM
jgi:hypothetical protein